MSPLQVLVNPACTRGRGVVVGGGGEPFLAACHSLECVGGSSRASYLSKI